MPIRGKRQGIETRIAAVLAASIVLLAAYRSLAPQPPMSVYVMDEFARVRPRDAPGSKRVAVVSAARNEYAPFQIVVRAGTGGLKRVNAAAGPLMPKRGKASRVSPCSSAGGRINWMARDGAMVKAFTAEIIVEAAIVRANCR